MSVEDPQICNSYTTLNIFPGRVDPCGMCEEEGRGKYTKTPVEIAAKEYTGEMLNILGEFTEIPESVKLGKMSDLLFTTEEVAKIQFRILLNSLPLDSVRGD